MHARWLGCLALCAVAACFASRNRSAAVPPPSPKDYVAVESAEQLAQLVTRDLERRAYEDAYQGLKKFTESSVLDGHEARGSEFMRTVRPVWRFQMYSGHSYIGAIEQLQIILDHGAHSEIGRAYSAVERNDVESLRRMSSDPRSFLGADVRPLASELAPHAALVGAFLRFDDLRHANPPSAEDARAIAAQLEGCCDGLEREKYAEAAFFARIVAAQALDLAGLEDEALERWIAVGKSAQLAHADESVQLAVAGRIQSYRDRLRDEMQGAIRSEEQAKANAAIQEAQAHNAQLSAEQKARIEALEGELQRVQAQHSEDTRTKLGAQRDQFSGTLAQQAQRISELEQLFVQIAVAEPRDWRAKNDALLAQSGGTVGFTSDPTTVWQAARFRAERSMGEPQ
jgi:hypothetical protein